MERYISSYEHEQAEAYNKLLTDELLEQADKMVTDLMDKKEDKARRVVVHSDSFCIQCRTTDDYRDYIFRVNEGKLEYSRMEGNFRN